MIEPLSLQRGGVARRKRISGDLVSTAAEAEASYPSLGKVSHAAADLQLGAHL